MSGTITFQGKPVTSGLINFMQENSRPMGGGIHADGNYQFELPPGKYLVRIDTPPSVPEGWKEGDPPSLLGRRQVPLKYSNFKTSGLTTTVGPEDDEKIVDFALK